jgi:hypothetical protein
VSFLFDKHGDGQGHEQGLWHNKNKAEVHPGHKLTGPKEEEEIRRVVIQGSFNLFCEVNFGSFTRIRNVNSFGNVLT